MNKKWDVATIARTAIPTVAVLAVLIWWSHPSRTPQWALIHPRTISGLTGVVFSPLTHVSPAHLLENLSFGVVATVGAVRFGIKPLSLAWLSVASWTVTGLGSWGFAPIPVSGSSGVVFALVPMTLLYGGLSVSLNTITIESTAYLIACSIPIVMETQGLLAGQVVPPHLFGILAGTVGFVLYRKNAKRELTL